VPVTTDPAKLLAEMEHRKRAKGLTVVFSTYQSLPAVATAQALETSANMAAMKAEFDRHWDGRVSRVREVMELAP
jgi:hypothetical protein